jgi:hypothetical protein
LGVQVLKVKMDDGRFDQELREGKKIIEAMTRRAAVEEGAVAAEIEWITPESLFEQHLARVAIAGRELDLEFSATLLTDLPGTPEIHLTTEKQIRRRVKSHLRPGQRIGF